MTILKIAKFDIGTRKISVVFGIVVSLPEYLINNYVGIEIIEKYVIYIYIRNKK